jgi:hypothetical protein
VTDYRNQTRYDEDEAQGDGLIRLQWMNGEPKPRTVGRFFGAADVLPEGFTPSAPWEARTETFQDGSSAEGFGCDMLTMAVVCCRQQPFHWSAAYGAAGRFKVWQEKWQKDPAPEWQSIQTDLLIYAHGFEELGQPVKLSIGTIKNSFAINSWGKSGLIKDIRDWLSDPASKAATEKIRAKDPEAPGIFIDTYSFWIDVATQRDAKGAVVYTPTKGRPATLPVLQRPAGTVPDLKWVRSRYVGAGDGGPELLEWLEQIRADYEPWRKERRTNDDQPEPVAAGRNVPQAYSEDEEVPF